MGDSKISWTDKTWNIIGGCTKASPACDNCYACRDSWRIMHNPKAPARYADVVEKEGDSRPNWTGRMHLDYDALDKPLHWKKPAKIFVASMSDLFHPDVPFEFIDHVFDTMIAAPWHTFQILTKRAKRMFEYMDQAVHFEGEIDHIWGGVTIEDQERANQRAPWLFHSRFKTLFVSAEPLLGNIDFDSIPGGYKLFKEGGVNIDWVITGGESGKYARYTDPAWFRSLRDQCVNAPYPVPFFFKQWGMGLMSIASSNAGDDGNKKNGGNILDGRTWEQFPIPW